MQDTSAGLESAPKSALVYKEGTDGDTITVRTIAGSVWPNTMGLEPELSIEELEGAEGNSYVTALTDPGLAPWEWRESSVTPNRRTRLHRRRSSGASR